ncbi:MAG: alpha/beta fold hydrolase [Stackebrandtia sp.]
MPHTFVLVHGAWRDSRAWAGVAEHLRSCGHDVYTPTIAAAGLDEAIDSLVDYIEREDLSDVVLVGHSLGGLYISLAAPRVASRLRRLVYLAAFVPTDGASLYDLMPGPAATYFRDTTGDDGRIVQPFGRVRDLYLSSLDADAARAAYAEMIPQPAAVFDTRVDTSDFDALLASGTLPVSYIDVTGDRVMGPAGWYACFAERLGPARLVQVCGQSHEITHTAPELTAAAIIDAGRE